MDRRCQPAESLIEKASPREKGRASADCRATLAARFGPDASMPDVLVALAACARNGDWSVPCRALFPDLTAEHDPRA